VCVGTGFALTSIPALFWSGRVNWTVWFGARNVVKCCPSVVPGASPVADSKRTSTVATSFPMLMSPMFV